MAKLWQLDYGYKVRVLEGEDKGKEGWVVYASDRGYICINTRKVPKDNSYQITEYPSNLEILSIDNPYNVKQKLGGLSNFDFAKIVISNEEPKKVLMNRQYFHEQTIVNARRALVCDLKYALKNSK
jgi:ribosomal protein L24